MHNNNDDDDDDNNNNDNNITTNNDDDHKQHQQKQDVPLLHAESPRSNCSRKKYISTLRAFRSTYCPGVKGNTNLDIDIKINI